MHFVYIDEVQDLTMSQVSLFKHVRNNVQEGFVFSGDALRSIAGGIDFKIQDILSLFDKKYILESRSKCDERKEKGRVANIFHLTQNFRTHAGILKLSQSILELCYHFFPLCIDTLEYETTKVNGEAPILLQSENMESAIRTLFGKSKNLSKSTIAFGAEQVILVRDENARQKIKDYVGKQALVLTILECKYLEFQVTNVFHLSMFYV